MNDRIGIRQIGRTGDGIGFCSGSGYARSDRRRPSVYFVIAACVVLRTCSCLHSPLKDHARFLINNIQVALLTRSTTLHPPKAFHIFFNHTHLPTLPPAYLSHPVAMADQSLIERRVVLGLGELQNNPTLTDGYAEILPFEDGAAGCECPWEPAHWFVGCRGCTARISFSGMKAKCIKRTRERWTVRIPSERYFFALH